MPAKTELGAETVGQRLRRLRLERGLSQRDLSQPGITYAYISRVEAGARVPSVKALRALAKRHGVTAEYLESGTDLSRAERRELRLTDLELRLRLDNDVDLEELDRLRLAADDDGDGIQAVRARIALGLALLNRGEHTEAIAQLETALATGLVSPLTRPDAYATLGRAYASHGTPQMAVELFDRALDTLRRLAPEDHGTRIRFSAYLSFALTDAADVSRARRVISDELSQTPEEVDAYTRVRLYWSLGRLAIEQADPPAALDSFRRAIALLAATEDTLHLARAHLNCTQALLDSDELAQAKLHLDQAQGLFGSAPINEDLVALNLLRAMLAARTQDYDAVESYATEGLRLAQDSPNQEAQLWWALGEGRAGAEDPTALEAFEKAADLMTAHGTPRERSNFLRSYGRYLRTKGRHEEALDALDEAAALAAGLGDAANIPK